MYLNLGVTNLDNICDMAKILIPEKLSAYGGDYKLSGVIQYNHKAQHYRTIKSLYL